MPYKDKKKKNEAAKKYRQKNKEKISDYQKEYYQKNKEQKKRYYEENKEQINERCRKYSKNHYQENKERLKKYREENKEHRKEYDKKRYHENKEKERERNKKYWEENKERIIKQKIQKEKIRYQEDITYRISKILRSRLRLALKGVDKSARTMELLGCSVEQLREHLEAQFADGMSWDNYGYYGWHIDHIRPCVSFDLTDPQQQLEFFHWTNLQPLWAEDNIKKGANLND